MGLFETKHITNYNSNGLCIKIKDSEFEFEISGVTPQILAIPSGRKFIEEDSISLFNNLKNKKITEINSEKVFGDLVHKEVFLELDELIKKLEEIWNEFELALSNRITYYEAYKKFGAYLDYLKSKKV